MKELSTEEKAKRYDEAFEYAHHLINKRCKEGTNNSFHRVDLEKMFPKLKESEDESIRKAIIQHFKTTTDAVIGHSICNIPIEKVLAWLEKQKTSDKALQYLKENHSPSEVSDFQAAMNIAVAKAYDKGYNDGLKNQYEQNPAEVRTTGYWNVQDIKQKPAWSEEDESMWLSVLQDLQNIKDCHPKVIVEPEFTWLKSIRLQTTWKPSDEQMDALDGICSYIRNKADWEISQDMVSDLYKLSEQLKKLREE